MKYLLILEFVWESFVAKGSVSTFTVQFAKNAAILKVVQ